MVRTSVHKYIPYIILPVAVFSVQLYIRLPIGNTFIWWGVFFVIFFILFWEARFSLVLPEDKRAIRIVKIYLLWNIISIARGVFMAENYWHYKNLIGMGMTLLLPIVVYVALNIQLVQKLLSFFIKFTLPFAILIFPFLGIGAWGWYLYPIALLMLFFPDLPPYGKVLVVFFTLLVVVGGIEARSNIIKFSVPVLLLILFYYPRHIFAPQRVMEIGRLLLILVPIVLISLGVMGIFNIFKLNQYLEGKDVEVGSDAKGNATEDELTQDTRTFIYEEVINSAIKYDYWLLGRSPARGNEAVWFAEEMMELYGEPERPRNEVGVLNVFTWTGIIGVVLYFLVFYQASFLAINRSRNIYAKLIGFFVAFRWFYTWVEDYQVLDTNNFVLWLLIGLSLSNSFRAMSNAEVKLWLWGIFKKEYYWVYNYYLKGKVLKSV